MELNDLSYEDQCLVHRYLYYCWNRSVISDHEYDALERKALRQADKNHMIHKVGSSNDKNYSDRIKIIAESLIE